MRRQPALPPSNARRAGCLRTRSSWWPALATAPTTPRLLSPLLQLTFVAFHVARGSPVADDQPLLANISIWDQIDGGKLWTPARRVLITVPALLFLITCEVTGYSLPHLVINVGVLVLLELSPKLPIVRRYVGGVLGLRPPKA